MNTKKTLHRKKHLLFLVCEDWYFVSHRLPIALAALAAGYHVTLLTRLSRHGDEIRNHGIKIIDLPFRRAGLNPVRELLFFWRLVQIYKNLQPDVVHHVALKPVIMGSLAARLANIPGVVNALCGLGFVFTSSASVKAQVLRQLLRPLVKLLLRVSLRGKNGTNGANSALILQNPDDREFLIDQGIALADSIKLIRGSGINPNDYQIEPPPSGKPCLVVLPSRMLADKGVREFVQAACLLQKQGVAARFALVGAPDQSNPASLSIAELESWAAQGMVEYWGWHANIAAVLAQADIVCLPSYREGLPKVLLEAIAAARAVITTDAPGCREVVQHGFNGLLVPVGNSEALALAMRTLILDADKRRLFGLNGRQRAEKEFSLHQVISATLAIYHQLQS